MKAIWITFLYLISQVIYACPTCVGSGNNPKAGYITYILSGFIVLTYIPFFLIYRTIIKHRNVNNE
jgi:hypothetical protein